MLWATVSVDIQKFLGLSILLVWKNTSCTKVETFMLIDNDRYLWFVRSGGSPGSSFETIGHDLHRLRRNAINPFFSKRSIVAMEPLIKEKISLLSHNFHANFANSTPVNLRVAFSSLTLDVISDYCYGKSFGALEDKKIGEMWSNTLTVIMSITTIVMHFPILFEIMAWLPDSLAGPVLVHHRVSRPKSKRSSFHMYTD